MSFRSLPCMATQKVFSTVSLLTFLAIAFTMLNLLLLFNLNFMSSMILSWLSFRHQTGLQVFYVTPALPFWFIVVSSVFHLFYFLDGSSPIPTTPTKFHHHLQAWIHSIPQVQNPSLITLEVLCIVVFTHNTHSSFIRITIG